MKGKNDSRPQNVRFWIHTSDRSKNLKERKFVMRSINSHSAERKDSISWFSVLQLLVDDFNLLGHPETSIAPSFILPAFDQ